MSNMTVLARFRAVRICSLTSIVALYPVNSDETTILEHNIKLYYDTSL